MNPLKSYLDHYRLNKYTDLLDIVQEGTVYRLFHGAGPLLTLKGNEFIHESERVAKLIVTDMMLRNERNGQGITAPLLYAFQKDVFEPLKDPFLSDWEKLLESDPFVTIKATGKFDFQPYNPEDELFSLAFVSLSALMGPINEFVHTTMREIIVEETDTNPFQQLLLLSYHQLSAERKIVIQAFSGMHGSGIVLPLVLVAGIISPLEYAKAMIALKIQDANRLEGILLDVLHAKDYLECVEKRPDHGCRAGLIIREGENDIIEFKSTLRWDIRAGKTNQAVERASLKTIAAFLNSSGGTLLIGVRDDGSIEGIESDKFANEDKFLLHLWTLIRTWLGRDVSPYISTELEKADEKTICMIKCRPGNRPVFLRQPGFEEAFYIRVGPSSNAMEISEALTYISDRFHAV